MFKDKIIVEELTSLINDLELSENQIKFRKKIYQVLPENIKNDLVKILYSECYALKMSYQNGLFTRDQNNFMLYDSDFLTEISQNNHTKAKIEHGWQIKNNYQNGFAEIIKFGVSKIVPFSDIKIQNSSSLINGNTVSVNFPKEDKNRQPTFFYVFSNQNLDAAQNLTRIYWNITSKGAPKLVDEITKRLNFYSIPFLFKCLNHPSLYFRRDAAVLYIEENMMPIITNILPKIHEEINEYLEQDVPLFSNQFMEGIGIAESPSSQESFGMNRMEIIATALLKIIPQKLSTKNSIHQIATAFLEKGINPSQTFLNKGSRILN